MNIEKFMRATRAVADAAPFIAGIHTPAQHAEALKAIEHMLLNDIENPFLNIVAAQVKAYEDTAPEFASGNELADATPPGIAVLRTLMAQHRLTLSDLPEIGSKSMVSRVLRGERKLNVDHIVKLSARFGISPALFIG